MSVPTFLIILDRGTAAEREAVQAIVKEHANGWWHHFTDVWFAGGRSASEWRDLIKPAIPLGRSSILVLRVPDDLESNDWTYFGVDMEERLRWLYGNL